MTTRGEQPRRVLVLTYEFPPAGGGGVQRVAKFVRYLPHAGWEPVVLTTEPSPMRPRDESLLADVAGADVTRIPARNVADGVAGLYARLRPSRSEGESAPARTQSTSASGGSRPAKPARSRQVAGWLSVPDFAGWWIGPAVSEGVRLGEARGVDAVFASGPPHSVLVAGARIARELDVPLLADFRDAWRDNPGSWYPTSWHRAQALDAERRVLDVADASTCVSAPIAAEVEEMGGRSVSVLPNGFDPADVRSWNPAPGPARIVFMGRMYEAASDPRPLLDAMVRAAELSPAAAQLTFEIVGTEAAFVREAVAARGLGERVVFRGYLPHAEALAAVAEGDAGVIVLRDTPEARAIYAGKLFEYLGIGVPVLLVGPTDGAAAEVLRDAGSSHIVSPGDVEAIARALVSIADDKAAGVRASARDPDVVARFDRRSQALEVAAILDSITERRAQ